MPRSWSHQSSHVKLRTYRSRTLCTRGYCWCSRCCYLSSDCKARLWRSTAVLSRFYLIGARSGKTIDGSICCYWSSCYWNPCIVCDSIGNITCVIAYLSHTYSGTVRSCFLHYNRCSRCCYLRDDCKAHLWRSTAVLSRFYLIGACSGKTIDSSICCYWSSCYWSTCIVCDSIGNIICVIAYLSHTYSGTARSCFLHYCWCSWCCYLSSDCKAIRCCGATSILFSNNTMCPYCKRCSNLSTCIYCELYSSFPIGSPCLVIGYLRLAWWGTSSGCYCNCRFCKINKCHCHLYPWAFTSTSRIGLSYIVVSINKSCSGR